MKVNCAVFEDFPFILSARDEKSGVSKVVKILRVSDGASSLAIRELDYRHEADSAKFVHESIVPMICSEINIDWELARRANCRVGIYKVLAMPWYTSTLHRQPSNCLKWIAKQGKRILDALQYLHTYPDGGYVHMDVKAINVFVDNNGLCYLDDFGSCKPIDEPITTSSITLCWEDARSQPAHPKYDYFMFLLMIMIECLEDRRTYTNIFHEGESRFASIAKIVEATKSRIELESTPPALAELLQGVLSKLIEFGVVQ